MGNPYTAVYQVPGADLVSQISTHQRFWSENGNRAIYLDFGGRHEAAREARATAEFHEEQCRIKRGALDKLNADRAQTRIQEAAE